jgi:hypothetical protein
LIANLARECIKQRLIFVTAAYTVKTAVPRLHAASFRDIPILEVLCEEFLGEGDFEGQKVFSGEMVLKFRGIRGGNAHVFQTATSIS